jgi:serine/threonine protein kinase
MAPADAQRGPAGAAELSTGLALIGRLCAPLAFLHGEGLVHRDLKPENVIVQPDGAPVLVDFGLIAQFTGQASRKALEVGGEMVGTVTYMAPEQILGDFVDARADLYSLGCILAELVTGRPPFAGADRVEIGRAHLHAEPLPPSELAGGLTLPLDDLALRLLPKRPRDRIGHANDVALALAELGAAIDAPAEAPAPRAYLYRPGFAGRCSDGR